MKILLSIGCLLLIGLTGCASSQRSSTPDVANTGTASSYQAESQSNANPTEAQIALFESAQKEAAIEAVVICKRVQVIGSKFMKKVCGPKSKWDKLSAQTETNKRTLREIQRR